MTLSFCTRLAPRQVASWSSSRASRPHACLWDTLVQAAPSSCCGCSLLNAQGCCLIHPWIRLSRTVSFRLQSSPLHDVFGFEPCLGQRCPGSVLTASLIAPPPTLADQYFCCLIDICVLSYSCFFWVRGAGSPCGILSMCAGVPGNASPKLMLFSLTWSATMAAKKCAWLLLPGVLSVTNTRPTSELTHSCRSVDVVRNLAYMHFRTATSSFLSPSKGSGTPPSTEILLQLGCRNMPLSREDIATGGP